MKNYLLTKTLILSGIQCEKKLWLDLNQEKQRKDKAIFRAGNRFGNVVRNHYGKGLDLSDEKNHEIALAKTNEAINSKDISVIYEGAFLYEKTYIRADVLIKEGDHWTLLEAKSATKVKDINFLDVAVQSYIIKKSGLNLKNCKLIIINNEFTYKGDQNYSNLIEEKDLTKDVLVKEKEINNRNIFIKIDIEGYDFKAIKGAKNLIIKNNCSVIFEFSKMIRSQKDYKIDYLNDFFKEGFELYNMYGEKLLMSQLEKNLDELDGEHDTCGNFFLTKKKLNFIF